MKKKTVTFLALMICIGLLTACGETTMDGGRDTNGQNGEYSNSSEHDKNNAADSVTDDAKNAVEDATDGVGNAAQDVVDGAEKVADDVTNGAADAVERAVGTR